MSGPNDISGVHGVVRNSERGFFRPTSWGKCDWNGWLYCCHLEAGNTRRIQDGCGSNVASAWVDPAMPWASFYIFCCRSPWLNFFCSTTQYATCRVRAGTQGALLKLWLHCGCQAAAQPRPDNGGYLHSPNSLVPLQTGMQCSLVGATIQNFGPGQIRMKHEWNTLKPNINRNVFLRPHRQTSCCALQWNSRGNPRGTVKSWRVENWS